MHEEAPRRATKVAPATDVREFFRETVDEVRARQRLEVRPQTEAYVVDLLVDFSAADQLFSASSGRTAPEPLVFMLKRAIEAPGPERARHLKRMGDTALVVSGFFSDSLARQLVDVDYYSSMGERAYDALGTMKPGSLGQTFRELAQKFLRIAEVLSEISERALVTSNEGILRLYERYVRTGSERLRWMLQERGLLAIEGKLS